MTQNQKDYCSEHLEHRPYVADLLGRLARFDEDIEKLRRGQLLPLTSEVVQDMVGILGSLGKDGKQVSVGYLTHYYDLKVDNGDDKRIMRVLRKLGYKFRPIGRAWYLA